jgi:hypothetical protein
MMLNYKIFKTLDILSPGVINAEAATGNVLWGLKNCNMLKNMFLDVNTFHTFPLMREKHEGLLH